MSDPLTAVSGPLATARLVPVVREASRDGGAAQARWLVEQGYRVIEVAATTPDWQSVVEELAVDKAIRLIAVGTVRDARDVHQAATLGAGLVATPVQNAEVGAAAARHGLAFAEGCFSPTEVRASALAGRICKVFPAGPLGPGYLRSLRAVQPDAVLMPSGGVRLGEVDNWLDAGALAVFVGDELSRAMTRRESVNV